MNMDNFTKAQQAQAMKILLKLTSGFKSEQNYDAGEVGFFAHDTQKKQFEMGFQNIEDYPESLNNSIQMMYKIIGDPDKEVYVNDWTIIPFNRAKQKYNCYKEKGQHKIFDIGYVYMGMGHIKVLACDLSTHMLFYHYAGGANGYESEYNFNEIVKMNPSIEATQHYFIDWFDYI